MYSLTVLPLFISSPLLLPLLSWRLRTGILRPTYMLKWVSFLLVMCVWLQTQNATGFSWKYMSALLRFVAVVAEVPGAKTHSYVVF